MQRRLAMLESRRCGLRLGKERLADRLPCRTAVAECMEANQQAHQRATRMLGSMDTTVRQQKLSAAS